MKLLVLSQYFPPEIGAPQARLDSFITQLVKRGHQIEVVTSVPNYPTNRIFPGYRGCFYKCEVRKGIRVHRLWSYPAVGAGLRRAINYASFSLNCLAGLFAAGDFDCLFVESPPLFLYLPARLMSLVRSRPYIFNVADLWPDSMTELGLLRNRLLVWVLRRMEKAAYANAMFVNAVTDGVADRLRADKLVPSGKVLLLPNGVDTELFRPMAYDSALARQLGLEGKKIILYAGTHGYAHNIDVALRAAKLLEGKDIHFVFIGNGSEKERLVEYSRSLRLSKVRFIPGVPPEDLASYYSISFAGLSTLRGEPLFEATRPVKVLSVMAAGKPVVYSGRGEGAAMVEKAGAGIVVPPDDERLLASAISNLAEDDRLADELGRNGREFVMQNLSWPAVVDSWLKSFEKAFNEGKNNRKD